MQRTVLTILLIASWSGYVSAQTDVVFFTGFGQSTAHGAFEGRCSAVDTRTYFIPIGLQLYYRAGPNVSIGMEFEHTAYALRRGDYDTFYLLGTTVKYDFDHGPVTWFLRGGVGLYRGEHVGDGLPGNLADFESFWGKTEFDYEPSTGANLGLGFVSERNTHPFFFSELVYQRIFARSLVGIDEGFDDIHILCWRVGMGIHL